MKDAKWPDTLNKSLSCGTGKSALPAKHTVHMIVKSRYSKPQINAKYSLLNVRWFNVKILQYYDFQNDILNFFTLWTSTRQNNELQT